MTTADEIVVDATFRFLHVRGYVDDNHKLTTWGKALEAALSVADEEQTVVGVEMLRLGLFTGNFATGTPVARSGKWLSFSALCHRLMDHQIRIIHAKCTRISSPKLHA